MDHLIFVSSKFWINYLYYFLVMQICCIWTSFGDWRPVLCPRPQWGLTLPFRFKKMPFRGIRGSETGVAGLQPGWEFQTPKHFHILHAAYSCVIMFRPTGVFFLYTPLSYDRYFWKCNQADWRLDWRSMRVWLITVTSTAGIRAQCI